jgi:hypothetical protein
MSRQFFSTAVSAVALSLAMMASPAFAGENSAISSCTPDVPDTTHPFTCNIYETDANGAPTEDTGLIALPDIVGTGWIVLLENGTDQSTSNWSDIIQFSNNTDTGLVEMWSNPESGFDPALLASVVEPIFLTEDPSGVTAYFSGGTQGLDNDYFFHSDADELGVPEPVTLSLFGAGLVGAAAMRRRRAKSA